MEYRRLGRSGLKVSEICLGTMTFGHGTDTAEAERIVSTHWMLAQFLRHRGRLQRRRFRNDAWSCPRVAATRRGDRDEGVQRDGIGPE